MRPQHICNVGEILLFRGKMANRE